MRKTIAVTAYRAVSSLSMVRMRPPRISAPPRELALSCLIKLQTTTLTRGRVRWSGDHRLPFAIWLRLTVYRARVEEVTVKCSSLWQWAPRSRRTYSLELRYSMQDFPSSLSPFLSKCSTLRSTCRELVHIVPPNRASVTMLQRCHFPR